MIQSTHVERANALHMSSVGEAEMLDSQINTDLIGI